MSEPLVLALDTSFGPVGVAIATMTGRVLKSGRIEDAAGRQTEVLPVLVDELFKSSGASIRDVRRVVVTVGPGAFTGIRIGLAFAKGVKVATGAEVLGVSSLECLAFQARAALPTASIAAVIDAKRGEAYVYGVDKTGACWLEPSLVGVNDAINALRGYKGHDLRVTGSGQGLVVGQVGQPITPNIEHVDVEELAIRAAGLDAAKYPPRPAYLREPDARLPA